MIYLIQGEDEFLRTDAVAARKAVLGDDDTVVDLNLTRLNGASLSLAELRGVADSMPFLADRRVVVVDQYSRTLEGRRGASVDGDGGREVSKRSKEQAAAFAAYLKQLPESTDLVFVESAVKTTGALVSAIRDAGGKTVNTTAPRLDSRDLIEWIKGRARHHGAKLKDDGVAQALSAYVGNQLRTLDNEIEKLALYADGHTVTVEDVELLVPEVREAIVFELVDALGTGNPRAALRLLRALVGEQRESPFYVLTMIVRQFRLMVQVKELQSAGITGPPVASELKIHPFVADKIGRQVRGFSQAELRAGFIELARIDAAIKHGDLRDAEAAIDAFIVETSRPAAGPARR